MILPEIPLLLIVVTRRQLARPKLSILLLLLVYTLGWRRKDETRGRKVFNITTCSSNTFIISSMNSGEDGNEFNRDGDGKMSIINILLFSLGFVLVCLKCRMKILDARVGE